jgi:fatty-acyl-CoA synthase
MIIPDLLARRAELAPSATACVDLRRGEALSFSALDRRAASAATALATMGVGEGDRVAVLCRNRVEFFELLFACARLGAVLVPLNWRMPPAGLRALLDDAAPVLLAYGEEDAEAAGVISRRGLRRLALDAPGTEGYASRCDAAEPIAPLRTWPAAQCWYLIYTSGTTGEPKGVIYTYGMALANYVNLRQALDISARDVTLNFLPLFHTAGINLLTLPTLIEGGCSLILPGFDAEAVVSLLAEGRLSMFFGVPAVYEQLSEHRDFDGLDLSRVRRWACGGAPMSRRLTERFLARGASVCNGMGMTETGPTLFVMDPASVAEKPGSVGKPQVLARVRVVARDGRECGPGEAGELWFSGPAVTPGYWRRPAETAGAFSGDGWLRSGDIGYRDEDGYFYVVGRLKEMFISGGENVYPAKVEQAILGHPDVLEAAVVARADRRWGEVGVAYVRARPGRDLPSAHALEVFCRERLAPCEVPAVFVAVTDFPRTAAGKIQKHRLAEAAPAVPSPASGSAGAGVQGER